MACHRAVAAPPSQRNRDQLTEIVFLCTSKPTKRVRSVMVRLVQCLGKGSFIGATPRSVAKRLTRHFEAGHLNPAAASHGHLV